MQKKKKTKGNTKSMRGARRSGMKWERVKSHKAVVVYVKAPGNGYQQQCPHPEWPDRKVGSCRRASSLGRGAGVGMKRGQMEATKG
ncbi:hypothetical protein CDL15_Pgr025848 [Punica granatum]|nr:hypothetical protein CDL15_Pgr025848 [Punica granatum]